MSKIKTGIIKIDEETGEVLNQKIVPDGFDVRLVSQKSLEAFKQLRDNTYDIHFDESYCKVYPSALYWLMKEPDITPNELKLVFAAMAHATKFTTGELVYQNLVPIKSEQLFEFAEIGKRNGYIALNSLIKRGIIARERRGAGYVYYGNPFIFVCGNSIDFDLLKMFRNTRFADAAVARINKKNERKKKRAATKPEPK